MTLVSSCPVWIPWAFDHTTLCPKSLSSFASSKVACELHQHLMVKPGGWNSTHNHLGPRDVQPCPEFVSFFSNQIHKPKSLQKNKGDCNSFKAFESPRSIWSIKEETHSPASRLVSDLSLPQPVAPWGNIRPLSKLPKGWEENASHSECRFMLSSHPKVCVVWMRSGSSLDSELGVSQSPPAGLPPGVTTAGAHPLCLEPKERDCSIAFLLLQEGRSADKIRTRLEAQWERNFHFGACRYLRAAQQWMQLSFTSSFPSWKSPSLRTRVPGSQVFTNLSAALEWVQGSVSHLLDEGDWTCSRALVPDWSSVPISGQEAQRWMLLRMLRLPLVGRGM